MGLVALALLAAFGSSAPLGVSAAQPRTPWIVQLEDSASLDGVLKSAAKRLGVGATRRFSHALNGFAAALNDRERRALLADERVTAIVADGVVRATGTPSTEAQPGIRRIGALANPDRTGGTLDVDIAIVDTGIQPNNPDLNVVGGYNCTGGGTGAWDDGASFGHGTHVAGIAAARDNGSGVEGVAAGARLWSIKVLTDSGLGYWSWVICGLDRVAAMGTIEVVNMSLAAAGSDDGNCGRDNHDPLHEAVCRLERAGVTMVVAAGNEHDTAANYIPAAYDEVITVSGMADYDGQPGGNGSAPSGCTGSGGVNAGPQGDDAFAKFSNYGPDVDVIAPAVCVYSNRPVNRFRRMTGTSMAAPHVAGAAALYYLQEKRLGRARPTPQQVRAALLATGSIDWRTNTDPDGAHEPLVDVSNFNLAADFTLSSTPQTLLATGGDDLAVDIWLARLGGFGGNVTASVVNSTLPPGATASINQGASLPDGAVARITIDMPGSPSPGTYDVVVQGASASATRTTKVRVIVEQPAVDGGPQMYITGGVGISNVAIPVLVDWSVGGTSFELQRSRDGGPWTHVANTSKSKFSTSAWPASRYQYRVRSGSGPWRYGTGEIVVPIYPDGEITLTGSWHGQQIFNSYSEIPVYSTQAGATATLNFSGRGVAWIATKGPTRGLADVFIDGLFVDRVNLYASSNKHRRIVFSHSFGSYGNHTFRIEVVGEPNSHPRVDVDTLLMVTR